MSSEQDCFFCKLAIGEAPAKKVYEDETFIVVLDINPGAEGHLLLLTKKHYQVMPQIPDEVLAHLALLSKKLSRMLLKSFNVKGVSLFVANGYAAGQKAPHFMMHIIPRKEEDSIKLNRSSTLELSDKAIEELRNKLISQPKKQEDADLDKIGKVLGNDN